MQPTGEHETLAPATAVREPFVRVLVATLAAPLLWVLHFALVFLLEGLLCTPMLPFASAIPAVIVAATVLGAGACAWLMLASAAWLRCAGGRTALQSHAFLVDVQRTFAGLALVAIVWGGSGVLLLAPCASAY